MGDAKKKKKEQEKEKKQKKRNVRLASPDRVALHFRLRLRVKLFEMRV